MFTVPSQGYCNVDLDFTCTHSYGIKFFSQIQLVRGGSINFLKDGGGRKGLRYCGIMGHFWCGVAVIFISKYGIAVFRVQAVCGKFKFYAAVVGEKIVVSR